MMEAMSSYFKSKPESLQTSSTTAALSRLLAVMADELVRTAEYVIQVGERLSSDAAKQERTQLSCDLQAFDIFAQTARSQAALLKRLAQGNLAEAAAPALLSSMIEDVPFAAIRQRLNQAVQLEENENTEHEADDTQVTWF